MSDDAPELSNYTPVLDSMVREVGPIPALVWGRMWRYSQMDRGTCNASEERIASDLGVDRRTIRRAKSKLIASGYIEDTTPNLRNAPHVYKINRCTKMVQQNQIGVTKEYSNLYQNGTARCDKKSHEDSIIKIPSKKELIGTNKQKSSAPPAVEAARSVAHKYPNKALWQKIDQEVGNADSDIQFWKDIVLAYIGQGWNPNNYANMLEFYGRREIPGTTTKSNNGRKQQDAPPNLRPIYVPTVFDEEVSDAN